MTWSTRALIRQALPDGLSSAQACMVRRLLRKHLSAGSSVFTIDVDNMLDGTAQQYVGLAHVTRVTMARLYMPWLLPCVARHGGQ